MAILNLFPTSSKSVYLFANIGNVIGNNASYATATNSIAVNGDSGNATLYFSMTDIPAGAIINGIRAVVFGRSSVASSRALYTVEAFNPGSALMTSNMVLTNADAYHWAVFDPSRLTTEQWRTNAMEWTFSFISKVSGSVTTYWQKAFLEIDYSMPIATNNALFVGENF